MWALLGALLAMAAAVGGAVGVEGELLVPSSNIPLADFIGLQHFSPCYAVNPALPSLLDGAEQTHRIGTRVFKFGLSDGTPARYPFHNGGMPWPAVGSFHSLAELAATPQVDALLHNALPNGVRTNFSTFVIWAYSVVGTVGGDGYWCKSFDAADVAREISQFRGLTDYLMRTFQGSGHTFVLEHWEGDWAARCGSYNATVPPTPAVVARMTGWLAARQRGVEEGRVQHCRSQQRLGHAAFASVDCADQRRVMQATKVAVHNGCEVNLVGDCLDNPRCGNLVEAVLPHVALDTVSYSSYDMMAKPSLSAALDLILARMNRTSASPDRPVFITEWGVPEMQVPQAKAAAVAHNLLPIAASKGFVSRVIYWQVINNELLAEAEPGNSRRPAQQQRRPRPVGAAVLCKTEVRDPARQRGFWAVLPNGTLSYFGALFQGILNGSRPFPPARPLA